MKKLENLEEILEGKWEFEDKYSHYSLIGERIIFCGKSYFGGYSRINDYDIVSNITQFRDFLKESFKKKTYKKENEKYLRKFLKVCELWLIDYLSRSTYNVDNDSLYTEYINQSKDKFLGDFEISFDEVLKKRKEILKDNEFFALMLKKENLFKKIENYQYMLRHLGKYDNEIQINFYSFVISFDISNTWNIKHKISIVNGRKNERVKYNRLNFDDVELRGAIYNKILVVFPKVKKIVKKMAEQYNKKYR